jgi:hypothetical protein
MVKAEFWTDAELLRWPLAKRVLYQGLWALAEDSGCLEDDPFGWKLQLFPSPTDAELSTEQLALWRDELVGCGKLFRYAADGKDYLFIRTFHQHEHPRNPQRPDLPLPPWISLHTDTYDRNGSKVSRCQYIITTDTLQLPNSDSTVTLLSPPPRLAPSRVPSGTTGKGGSRRPVDKSTVRPAAESGNGNGNSSLICYRCGGEIVDVAVESAKGLRHETCPVVTSPQERTQR